MEISACPSEQLDMKIAWELHSLEYDDSQIWPKDHNIAQDLIDLGLTQRGLTYVQPFEGYVEILFAVPGPDPNSDASRLKHSSVHTIKQRIDTLWRLGSEAWFQQVNQARRYLGVPEQLLNILGAFGLETFDIYR